MLTSRLAGFDLTVVRVPGLIIVNRETTTLREVVDLDRTTIADGSVVSCRLDLGVDPRVGGCHLPVRATAGRTVFCDHVAVVGLLCWCSRPGLFQLVLNLVLVQLIEIGNWAATDPRDLDGS